MPAILSEQDRAVLRSAINNPTTAKNLIAWIEAAELSTRQVTPTAKTAAATLTIAELLTGIITETDTTGATVAFTLPTGTLTDAGLPSTFAVDDAFEYTIINLSAALADTVTVTAGTGHTIVGNPIIDSAHDDAEWLSSGTFRCRKTAANTFVSYRIG